MWNTPTPKQVQVVIDNLTKALKLANNNCPINMTEGSINFDHPCGSPMCHGGWYAVVSGNDSSDYLDGANYMAKHLGFEDCDELEEWAGETPLIWGNRFGDVMFSSPQAFNLTDQKLTNLSQIIDHWKGVKKRIIVAYSK